jgi:ABC-type dipeptide/oligopeptide/nickel transport system permease component
MLHYAARRLLLLVPVLVGILALVFLLVHLIPGDPAAVLLGPQNATPAAVRALRHSLGLDRPLGVQFLIYLGRVARGDLGTSIFQNIPVGTVIAQHLPATVELTVSAMVVGILLGLAAGVAAAVRRGSVVDVAGSVLAQLGVSMPVFWLGILLILWFAVDLRWLPAFGRGAPLLAALAQALAGRPAALVDSLRHLALPAVSLGLGLAALMSRMVRASMLETLQQDYIRTARAKGAPPAHLVMRHALRNALLPVVTVVGLQFGSLLGGAVLTETIFGWPGVGQLLVTAIGQRDFPIVQGTTLVTALLFSLVTLAVDLLYAAIDPRIRYS